MCQCLQLRLLHLEASLQQLASTPRGVARSGIISAIQQPNAFDATPPTVVLRSHAYRGNDPGRRPMASSAATPAPSSLPSGGLVCSDITRGRLYGYFHGGEVFDGRHTASSVVAGFHCFPPLASSATTCPRPSRAAMSMEVTSTVPVTWLHPKRQPTILLSPSPHGRGRSDIPAVIRAARHPMWPSCLCPRKHDRGRPVASSTTVALS